MPTWRVQTVGQPKTSDPGRDYVTNVLYYISSTTPASNIGDALNAAFGGSAGPYFNFANVQTRVYDHANPLHSPPVYTKNLAGLGTPTLGPRQVASCVSFYSGLNVKGKRGRIYIGPIPASDMQEYIPTGWMTVLQTLIGQLKTPGGPDVVHQIFHPKTATFTAVTNYFANNRWDTMRSRLPKETSRYTSP